MPEYRLMAKVMHSRANKALIETVGAVVNSRGNRPNLIMYSTDIYSMVC